MKDFPLIRQLDHPEEDKPSSTSGIKYQQYELEIQGNPRVINIPLRETEAFEQALENLETDLDEDALRTLLRNFRGIRG